MVLEEFRGIKRIYFIGIGGVSMSALAKFMSIHGFGVVGSDKIKSEEIIDIPNHRQFAVDVRDVFV